VVWGYIGFKSTKYKPSLNNFIIFGPSGNDFQESGRVYDHTLCEFISCIMHLSGISKTLYGC
jgi:hypothetical protein